MELKAPMSFEQQLDILKSHGVDITDRDAALDVLMRINYYRFTGYALQFRVNPNGSTYRKSTSFESIYNLYKLDERLRDLLRIYIEQVEVYYRTQIAYGFAMKKCVESPYDQHYDESNFYNKKGYEEVIKSFQREKNYYKDIKDLADRLEEMGEL